MYICCAYSAALMEDIRYQPPLRAMEPSFLLMVLFGILLWAYHSLLYQSVYMSPILPFSFLILSPQDGILVCGRKKAILDSYTSDSLWLRMWWHKIGIRGFVSPFFLLPLFFVLNEALNPVIFILSSLLLEVHGTTLFVALSYFQQGPARFNFFHVFHYI